MGEPKFNDTPQAKDDVFATIDRLTEDNLTIVYLTVTANDDLGGNAKTLWSVDNGVNDTGAMSGYIAADLLTQDAARAEATSGDTSLNGAKIWITDDGTVGYDASTLSAAFKAQLDSLGTNQTLTDSFIYAIQLGNGALSWATVTVQFGGSNEAVTIAIAPQSGLVVEDAPLTPDPGDSLSATGTISFTDADLSDGHTASFVPAPGNTTALGTFSLDPVSEAANVANGSVQWHYALNNGAAQYLAAGQSVVEHYTVTVDDGHGSTATKVVTITITGTNDPISTPIDVDAAVNSVAENAAIGTLVGVTASTPPTRRHRHHHLLAGRQRQRRLPDQRRHRRRHRPRRLADRPRERRLARHHRARLLQRRLACRPGLHHRRQRRRRVRRLDADRQWRRDQCSQRERRRRHPGRGHRPLHRRRRHEQHHHLLAGRQRQRRLRDRRHHRRRHRPRRLADRPRKRCLAQHHRARRLQRRLACRPGLHHRRQRRRRVRRLDADRQCGATNAVNENAAAGTLVGVTAYPPTPTPPTTPSPTRWSTTPAAPSRSTPPPASSPSSTAR